MHRIIQIAIHFCCWPFESLEDFVLALGGLKEPGEAPCPKAVLSRTDGLSVGLRVQTES